MEWRMWLTTSLATSVDRSSVRARALRALSIVCDLTGDYEAAESAATQAMALTTRVIRTIQITGIWLLQEQGKSR